MPLSAVDYRQRDAEHGVLYRVIDEHLETFIETARRHADGASLPEFVEQEFRDFLTCGVNRLRYQLAFDAKLCGAVLSLSSAHQLRLGIRRVRFPPRSEPVWRSRSDDYSTTLDSERQDEQRLPPRAKG